MQTVLLVRKIKKRCIKVFSEDVYINIFLQNYGAKLRIMIRIQRLYTNPDCATLKNITPPPWQWLINFSENVETCSISIKRTTSCCEVSAKIFRPDKNPSCSMRFNRYLLFGYSSKQSNILLLFYFSILHLDTWVSVTAPRQFDRKYLGAKLA
jgi:hypothetical protein